MALRGPTYFDQINFQKFAIAYLLNISFFQLGEQNWSRMMECEGMQLGRLLNLHKSSEEDGLNCIEVQLRRKGFWLLFYGYVFVMATLLFDEDILTPPSRHSQLQNLRREKLVSAPSFDFGCHYLLATDLVRKYGTVILFLIILFYLFFSTVYLVLLYHF